MKTVNKLDSLIVDIKISTLVVLGVLYWPLCEIKMSKLDKQRINELEYYQINIL